MLPRANQTLGALPRNRAPSYKRQVVPKQYISALTEKWMLSDQHCNTHTGKAKRNTYEPYPGHFCDPFLFPWCQLNNIIWNLLEEKTNKALTSRTMFIFHFQIVFYKLFLSWRCKRIKVCDCILAVFLAAPIPRTAARAPAKPVLSVCMQWRIQLSSSIIRINNSMTVNLDTKAELPQLKTWCSYFPSS